MPVCTYTKGSYTAQVSTTQDYDGFCTEIWENGNVIFFHYAEYIEARSNHVKLGLSGKTSHEIAWVIGIDGYGKTRYQMAKNTAVGGYLPTSLGIWLIKTLSRVSDVVESDTDTDSDSA